MIYVYYRQKGVTTHWLVYPARDEAEAQRIILGLIASGFEVVR